MIYITQVNFLKKLVLCIGDIISHQSGELDMHQSSFAFLTF